VELVDPHLPSGVHGEGMRASSKGEVSGTEDAWNGCCTLFGLGYLPSGPL
jgi:hypothetical protein